MKGALLVGLLGVLWPLKPMAFFTDGSKLVEVCENNTRPAHIGCEAFINGVFDGTEMALKRLCGPGDMTNGQLIAAVKKYLRDHPAEHHLPAAHLVLLSLKDAFGC
jgi:hypothetical protein